MFMKLQRWVILLRWYLTNKKNSCFRTLWISCSSQNFLGHNSETLWNKFPNLTNGTYRFLGLWIIITDGCNLARDSVSNKNDNFSIYELSVLWKNVYLKWCPMDRATVSWLMQAWVIFKKLYTLCVWCFFRNRCVEPSRCYGTISTDCQQPELWVVREHHQI